MKTDSNNPSDWLFLANSDLEALQILIEHESGYYMCRSKLAEVLEKILKAELIRLGWILEKTHDLQKLTDELSDRKSDIIDEVQELGESLSEAYIAGRYPGFDLEDPDWPSLKEKVRIISNLLIKIKSRINDK